MDETAALLVELGGVFVALSLLGALARWLRISPIPLFLLAGLAVGEGGLLPLDAAEPFVEIGAELGVVLLLFALGLEFSAAEFGQSLRRHARPGWWILPSMRHPAWSPAFCWDWAGPARWCLPV